MDEQERLNETGEGEFEKEVETSAEAAHRRPSPIPASPT